MKKLQSKWYGRHPGSFSPLKKNQGKGGRNQQKGQMLTKSQMSTNRWRSFSARVEGKKPAQTGY